MSISAKCPNGHVLKVKDEYAGKSGLCPHCGSRVSVPVPSAEKSRISDDDILGLLGEPSKVTVEPPPLPPSNPQMESVHDGPKEEESGISLLSSSISAKQKLCPKCANVTSVAFRHCPRCGTPLPTTEPEKSGKARPNIK
jgi:hypothetical protein